MAKLVLDTAIMEEDFFSDSYLMAIGSALPAYSLCWWLNQSFDLQFLREPEWDVCIRAERTAPAGANGLFALIGEEEPESIHYPVFKYSCTYQETTWLLYSNRIESQPLLSELRHADYLLLLQSAGYLKEEIDWLGQLADVPGVAWARQVDLKVLKSRKRLII